MVDDADGPGAADRRRVLHHGQQLCLAVVCESVANGHRHDVVDVLSGTIVPIHASTLVAYLTHMYICRHEVKD